MADYDNILIDHIGTDGRVGRITLNRPEKLNALSTDLLFELNDALHDMEAEHETRVIILRGAGISSSGRCYPCQDDMYFRVHFNQLP